MSIENFTKNFDVNLKLVTITKRRTWELRCEETNFMVPAQRKKLLTVNEHSFTNSTIESIGRKLIKFEKGFC